MIKYYRAFGVTVHLNNPFILYDYAIVYRLPSIQHYWLIKLLKKITGRVYFDTVVNYFTPHAFNNPKNEFYQKKIAEICDGIICSTESIAHVAEQYTSNVFVMDDPIEEACFTPILKPFHKNHILFGWSGISSKATALNDWHEWINKKITICSDSNIYNQNLNFEYNFFKWRYETFIQDIGQCNIAFLPRNWKNDIYNLGHSSFKALVYAALGIPIIANAIPSYRKLSEYYDGIVFLEDYNSDITKCLNALDGWDPSGKLVRVRHFYSCSNQAKRLIRFLTHG